MEEKKSLDPNYFKDVYDANDDPWNFETSKYESAKYASTIAALPKEHYENVLEIGCSIGVLTELLASRAAKLLATDVSDKALEIAARRNKELQNVFYKNISFPRELPDDQYDLIMVSEVAYYLSPAEWKFAIESLYERLKEKGHIVLVHWLPQVHDYPQTGDQVHNTFKRSMESKMNNIFSAREECYRLDVWEKL